MDFPTKRKDGQIYKHSQFKPDKLNILSVALSPYVVIWTSYF